MDFILNSKTHKVEITYESAEEQQAILEFMSHYITYRSDKTNITNPKPYEGVSWANSTLNTIASTNNVSSISSIDIPITTSGYITTTDCLDSDHANITVSTSTNCIEQATSNNAYPKKNYKLKPDTTSISDYR